MDNLIKNKYKSLFISDVHLGSIKAHPEYLIELLKQYSFENIFIVGDFIDIWQLKSKRYWPQIHTDLIRKILKRSKTTNIIYVLGNHDDFLNDFTDDLTGVWGNIKVVRQYEYCSKKNILIMHGHEFDNIVKYTKWLALIGDYAYELIIKADLIINKIKKMLGMNKRTSLSQIVKTKIKHAVNFICNFEESVTRHAKILKFDTVICGHIHTPAHKNINNIEYLNCGDWVENMSYILEDYEGNLILKKMEILNARKNSEPQSTAII